MNILFLAPSYNNLYIPVLNAMRRAGHNVIYIEDKELRFTPYRKDKGWLGWIKRKIKYLYYFIFNIEKRYWEKKIRCNYELSNRFDVLFCIQGLSFCKYLLTYLKQNNEYLKTSLYVWDSNTIFDFSRNFKLFDKVYTFDLFDSLQFRISFLPFYWTSSSVCNAKYDISIIGTEHDGRLRIVEQIAKQLDGKNVKFYFKILSTDPQEFNSPYVIRELLPVSIVERIVSESNCILDTDRETQTGTTPRVIWALANGKKIISTNSNFKKMPFYDKNQIMIIDRDNPIVDINFIKDKINFPISEYVNMLHIDKWILNFIN